MHNSATYSAHRATHLKVGKGLPWRPILYQESACQRRGHRLHPWSGKTPHAEGQRSPCATTAEPARRAAAIRGPQRNQGRALRHPRPSAAKHTETKTPKVSFLSMVTTAGVYPTTPTPKKPTKNPTLRYNSILMKPGVATHPAGEAVRKAAP